MIHGQVKAACEQFSTRSLERSVIVRLALRITDDIVCNKNICTPVSTLLVVNMPPQRLQRYVSPSPCMSDWFFKGDHQQCLYRFQFGGTFCCSLLLPAQPDKNDIKNIKVTIAVTIIPLMCPYSFFHDRFPSVKAFLSMNERQKCGDQGKMPRSTHVPKDLKIDLDDMMFVFAIGDIDMQGYPTAG